MASDDDIGTTVLRQLQRLDPAGTDTIRHQTLTAVLQGIGVRADQSAQLLAPFSTREGSVSYRDLLADIFPREGARPRAPAGATSTAGHPLRALSVEYLVSELLKEVEAANLPRAAPIYKIKDLVILPKGRGVRCPRDGELHCAYVDAVPEGGAGCATMMLSYTWGYAVGDIVDALLQFCRDQSLPPAGVFVWMCWSCINQHRVDKMAEQGLAVPFADFQKTFADRVGMVGHVLALMAPWEMPRYLSRIWCVFEMFTAVSLGGDLVKVTILMPPEQNDRLAATLRENASWSQRKSAVSHVFDALSQVDVLKAEATVESDRKQILQLIAEGVGAARVNTTVSSYLKQWLVGAMEKIAWQTLNDGGLDAEQRVRLLAPTAAFLREVGLSDQSISLLEAGLRLVPESSPSAGDLWASLGGVFLKKGGASDLGNARRAYVRALQIKTAEDGFTGSTEHATLLNALGVLMRKGGDIDAAMGQFQHTRRVFEETGDLETTRHGAMVLGNIGHCLFLKGALDDAIPHLKAGLRILETIGLLVNPDTSLMLNTLGEVLMQQSNLNEACVVFQQALDIRTQTCSAETRPGRIVQRNLSEARERMAAMAAP